MGKAGIGAQVSSEDRKRAVDEPRGSASRFAQMQTFGPSPIRLNKWNGAQRSNAWNDWNNSPNWNDWNQLIR